MKYYFGILLLVIVCVSCGHKMEQKEITTVNVDSIGLKVGIVNSVGVLLSEDARTALKTWGEYQKVDILIGELFNTSKSDVLENAGYFSDNIQLLRDSIRIEELDNPKIISRLNILLNESLRLKDMTDIPAISDAEVTDEVRNVLRAFSSLNIKINTHYKTKKIEKVLKDFKF